MKTLILALLVFFLASPAFAGSVTLAWDNGLFDESQKLLRTEVLIDGLPIGAAQGDSQTFFVDLQEFAFNPGDQITFTARHVIEENQIERTGPESVPLLFTVPTPLGAPSLRIQIIID